MDPKTQITKSLEKIVGIKDIQLDVPEREENGDYSSNIAMQLFARLKTPHFATFVAKAMKVKEATQGEYNLQLKTKGDHPEEAQATEGSPANHTRCGGIFTPGVNLLDIKINISDFNNPPQLAESLVEKLKSDKSLMKIVEKIEVAGGGFINFHLTKSVLVHMLQEVLDKKDDYGKSDIGKNKTVVIDYSSPNIAKPFGIGHLRSTIIGQSLYNIFKYSGYKVIGDNHLGDWGTQFGKLLYMIDKLHEGNPPQGITIDDLEQLYVRFHQEAKDHPQMDNEARAWFKKLEENEPTARKLWEFCLNISMQEYDKIYDLLGIKIDYAYGESTYENEMKRMIADFEEGKLKGLEDGEEGSKIVDLKDYGIKVPLMFLKSDGTTTYATRDLACIRFRVNKWNPDIFIYEVGVQQALHFQQVFAAAKKIGLITDNQILHHTKHGWYLGSDGKKFSTREGKTVKLLDILNEAIERAKKLGSEDEKTARKVGVGAIIYNDLMRSVQTDVVFDWEKIINMNGNSGPYIQYAYARTQSVLAKQKTKNLKLSHFLIPNAYCLLPEEYSLLRTLVHFPEVVQQAGEKYSPNLICEYLFSLAQKFNTFYNAHRIIETVDSEQSTVNSEQIPNTDHCTPTTEFRLALTSAVGIILKNGLNLLGIDSPQKM